MKIKITADSTCDLSPELIAKYDIEIIPMTVIRGDEVLLDGIDITPRELIEYNMNSPVICKTSATNVAAYTDIFARLLKEYDAVIHVSLSSVLSTSNQSANIAAAELGNVYVIDSFNLSTGTGLLVLDAAEMAAQGMAPENIKKTLDEKKTKIESSFVIDSLTSLHKGGRCSSLAALGANVLKLKPCIEVVDGGMSVGKKYRGDISKVVIQYVKERLSGRNDIDTKRLFITHAEIIPDGLPEAAKAAVEECMHFDEVYITTAGCTISNHCGPNVLGLLFYKK